MIKYEKDKIVTGCVTGIEKYGVFIGLDEFYSGLIHISEISNNYVRNIEDYVNVGETIKAKVIEADDDNYHVKLSIKNIDYRINQRKKKNISEVGSGFEPLRKQLSVWINDRSKMINNEKN